MMTTLYGIAAIFVFAVGIGFLAPTLVSSTSNLGVLIGFLVIPLTGVVEYYLFRSWKNTEEGKIVIEKLKGN